MVEGPSGERHPAAIMLVLQETPAGFGLFKVDDAKMKKADTEVR